MSEDTEIPTEPVTEKNSEPNLPVKDEGTKEVKEEAPVKATNVEEVVKSNDEGAVAEDTDEVKEGKREGEEGFVTPEEEESAVDEDKLDDDQDIENPAYIPKTGKYYMHDSRDDSSNPGGRDEKKSRADGKWSRDRFDERYQQPRTRKQMIEKYGFDIRLGETQEIAEQKEKEMRAAGLSLDDEEEERRDIRQRRERRNVSDAHRGAPRFNRQGGRREDLRRAEPEGENDGGRSEDEEIRPAARRDRRDEGRGRGGGGVRGGEREVPFRGEREVQLRGRGGGERMDRGRGGGGGGRGGYAPRQFNRTFNNSNRGTTRKEEERDGQAPKRYSTQRSEKMVGVPQMVDQPTDIVYFDPSKQTAQRDTRPVVREKKPLDIVPPPN